MSDPEKPFFVEQSNLIAFLGYVRHMARPRFRRRTEATKHLKKVLRRSVQASNERGFPNLDAWILLAEEFGLYLYQLHFHFLQRLTEKPCNLTRALFGLIGGAATDYMAVLKLVQSGYDAPARTVLRSLIEKLETVFVLLDDNTLVEKFAEEDLSGREFWYRHVRAGRSLKAKIKVLHRLDLIEDGEDTRTYWENRYMTLDPFKHTNREAGGISVVVFGSGRAYFEPGMSGVKTDFSTDTLRTMVAGVCDVAMTFAELAKQDDPLSMSEDKVSRELQDIAAFHSVVFPMWEFIVSHQHDPLLMVPDDDEDDEEQNVDVPRSL